MLRLGDRTRRPADPVLRVQLGGVPRTGEEGAVEAGLKEACAAVYASPAVRWLLGGELHPGGEASTRRALELIGVGPRDHLLDVASGIGASALLAARERGCAATGIEWSEVAVADARRHAEAAGVGDLVSFVAGDAESLPFADSRFDAVLCECSLCTFADKLGALREVRRVLRPGGRLALCDVVADRERLPPVLEGQLAMVACVGDAVSAGGWMDLLGAAGLQPGVVEPRDADAAVLADRVHDRLRAARIIGLDSEAESPVAIEDAIALVAAARDAIEDGVVGYSIFTATR